jgi:hypothetical protein
MMDATLLEEFKSFVAAADLADVPEAVEKSRPAARVRQAV